MKGSTFRPLSDPYSSAFGDWRHRVSQSESVRKLFHLPVMIALFPSQVTYVERKIMRNKWNNMYICTKTMIDITNYRSLHAPTPNDNEAIDLFVTAREPALIIFFPLMSPLPILLAADKD